MPQAPLTGGTNNQRSYSGPTTGSAFDSRTIPDTQGGGNFAVMSFQTMQDQQQAGWDLASQQAGGRFTPAGRVALGWAVDNGIEPLPLSYDPALLALGYLGMSYAVFKLTVVGVLPAADLGQLVQAAQTSSCPTFICGFGFLGGATAMGGVAVLDGGATTSVGGWAILGRARRG